jgi:hypothetical protein
MDFRGTNGDDVINQATLGLADFTNIYGGDGNDIITLANGSALGQRGNDTIIGALGSSSAVYWDSPVGINADLSTGVVQDGYGTVDTLVNITVLHTSGNNDIVKGSSRDETFWENGGSNLIDGGGGKDLAIYYGVSGPDAVISYDAAAKTFTVIKNFTNGNRGTDRLVNVESIIFMFADGTKRSVSVEDFVGPFKASRIISIPVVSGSMQQIVEGDFNGDGKIDIWLNRLDGVTIGDILTPFKFSSATG